MKLREKIIKEIAKNPNNDRLCIDSIATQDICDTYRSDCSKCIEYCMDMILPRNIKELDQEVE